MAKMGLVKAIKIVNSLSDEQLQAVEEVLIHHSRHSYSVITGMRLVREQGKEDSA